ncbi:unnamed protein product [Amoebophrya sp. A25]|nr:unnamed protein product [Amoebophrya sp. A25]|eukprot:GSA25T00001457001.1
MNYNYKNKNHHAHDMMGHDEDMMTTKMDPYSSRGTKSKNAKKKKRCLCDWRRIIFGIRGVWFLIFTIVAIVVAAVLHTFHTVTVEELNNPQTFQGRFAREVDTFVDWVMASHGGSSGSLGSAIGGRSGAPGASATGSGSGGAGGRSSGASANPLATLGNALNASTQDPPQGRSFETLLRQLDNLPPAHAVDTVEVLVEACGFNAFPVFHNLVISPFLEEISALAEIDDAQNPRRRRGAGAPSTSPSRSPTPDLDGGSASTPPPAAGGSGAAAAGSSSTPPPAAAAVVPNVPSDLQRMAAASMRGGRRLARANRVRTARPTAAGVGGATAAPGAPAPGGSRDPEEGVGSPSSAPTTPGADVASPAGGGSPSSAAAGGNPGTPTADGVYFPSGGSAGGATGRAALRRGSSRQNHVDTSLANPGWIHRGARTMAGRLLGYVVLFLCLFYLPQMLLSFVACSSRKLKKHCLVHFSLWILLFLSVADVITHMYYMNNACHVLDYHISKSVLRRGGQGCSMDVVDQAERNGRETMPARFIVDQINRGTAMDEVDELISDVFPDNERPTPPPIPVVDYFQNTIRPVIRPVVLGLVAFVAIIICVHLVFLSANLGALCCKPGDREDDDEQEDDNTYQDGHAWQHGEQGDYSAYQHASAAGEDEAFHDEDIVEAIHCEPESEQLLLLNMTTS